MNNIVYYKTVYSTGPNAKYDLDSDVMALIKQGWQPLSGVSHHGQSPDYFSSFAQTMVKYESENGAN